MTAKLGEAPRRREDMGSTRVVDPERARVAALERQVATYEPRLRELQEQNTNLIQLTVASQLLAAASGRSEVLATVEEIIVNMVGSEEIAIFDVAADGLTLAVSRTAGIAADSARVVAAHGAVRRAATTGKILTRRAPADAAASVLTAAVPIKLGTTVLAVVAIFRLLEQKPELEPVDHELFEIVSRQAAFALHCATCRSVLPTTRPPR